MRFHRHATSIATRFGGFLLAISVFCCVPASADIVVRFTEIDGDTLIEWGPGTDGYDNTFDLSTRDMALSFTNPERAEINASVSATEKDWINSWGPSGGTNKQLSSWNGGNYTGIDFITPAADYLHTGDGMGNSNVRTGSFFGLNKAGDNSSLNAAVYYHPGYVSGTLLTLPDGSMLVKGATLDELGFVDFSSGPITVLEPTSGSNNRIIFQMTSVPEPASSSLFLVAVAIGCVARRRR